MAIPNAASGFHIAQMYKKYIDVHFFNHYIFVNFADLILDSYGTETVYT